MKIKSPLRVLMTRCFSTRASVATVLSTHPCVSSCSWVNTHLTQESYTFACSFTWVCFYWSSRLQSYSTGARAIRFSLGAGNYHQPQLPSANMADSDVGTERYSLFMQILSTHFGVWGLYTIEYHVCTY